MPTYEYKCKQCGFKFEEFQSIVSDPIRICPVCNTAAVERIINGGAGLIFKGSGFYLTDYKHKNSSGASSGSGSSASSDSSASSASVPKATENVKKESV